MMGGLANLPNILFGIFGKNVWIYIKVEQLLLVVCFSYSLSPLQLQKALLHWLWILCVLFSVDKKESRHPFSIVSTLRGGEGGGGYAV